MVNRVVVNIQEHLFNIILRCNSFAMEVLLKQAACPIVFFIKGFGVGVEKIRKILVWRFETFRGPKTFQVYKTFRVLQTFQVFKTWKV